MKRNLILLMISVSLLGATLLMAGGQTASAQTGGGYDLTWNSIDGGGATFSTGGGYSLGGTIGQADAGAASGGTTAGPSAPPSARPRQPTDSRR